MKGVSFNEIQIIASWTRARQAYLLVLVCCESSPLMRLSSSPSAALASVLFFLLSRRLTCLMMAKRIFSLCALGSFDISQRASMLLTLGIEARRSVGTPFRKSWSAGCKLDEIFLVESLRGRDMVRGEVYIVSGWRRAGANEVFGPLLE